MHDLEIRADEARLILRAALNYGRSAPRVFLMTMKRFASRIANSANPLTGASGGPNSANSIWERPYPPSWDWVLERGVWAAAVKLILRLFRRPSEEP